MTRSKAKKICICHYRIGKTDGVSLEIMKRKKVLEQMGYQVKLISGTKQIGADKIIRELEFDRPTIVKIKENAFSGFDLIDNEKGYENGDDLLTAIYKVARTIKKQFLKYHAEEKFDYLFLHNIFSHGRHIAAAKAFHDVITETNIKVIAFHHDFYENYEGRYAPRFKEIETYLKTYVPPCLKNIKHVTINSLSKKLLYKKIKRKSFIFPDTFEFKQKPWVKKGYNLDLLEGSGIKDNDLIILQATRIVRRKGIELTIDLITELNKRRNELIGKKLYLYNRKKLDKKSDIVLVFGQFVEQDSLEYRDLLVKKMNEQGVKYKFWGSQIEHERMKRKGKKIYSLWDAYVFADLISYPSTFEGFGNQFLEAVFAKKPIVLFEYPVFEKDIKEEHIKEEGIKGYHYISLGSKFERDEQNLAYIEKKTLENATEATIKTLLDPQTKQALNNNFQIAKKFHGEEALEKLLQDCLD